VESVAGLPEMTGCPRRVAGLGERAGVRSNGGLLL
jgi:hypothetical protein